MTQTSNRFFDEMARLMNDAAGVAQGVRREFDTLFRSQAERILRDLDIVQREEFEAVKEMARKAREENEALQARIVALEARIAAGAADGPAAPTSGGPAVPPPPPFSSLTPPGRSTRSRLERVCGSFLVFPGRRRYKPATAGRWTGLRRGRGPSTPGGMPRKPLTIRVETRTTSWLPSIRSRRRRARKAARGLPGRSVALAAFPASSTATASRRSPSRSITPICASASMPGIS